MDLQDFVRKYIWDQEKTPYFRSVRRLTKSQADNEIKIYAIFLGTIFTIMEILSASTWVDTGEFMPGVVAVYCAFLVATAVMIWRHKDVRAALFCVTAPIATAMNFMFDGFHGELHEVDRYILIGFCLLWLRYTLRVLSICRRYDNMPQRPTRI